MCGLWVAARRPFIMIGGLVSTIAFLALPHIRGISHITGITDIILIASIIALFLDLSVNVTFNPARSIIADLTPEGKVRTSGYVWMQIMSVFFGVFAYFLSMVFGNETLLYIAAVIVFLTAVFPILFIQEKKDFELAKTESQEKYGVWQIFKEIFPLYGFLVFGIFSLFFHFFTEALAAWHNPVLITALAYSVIIGIYIIIQGTKNKSNRKRVSKNYAGALVYVGGFPEHVYFVRIFYRKPDIAKYQYPPILRLTGLPKS